MREIGHIARAAVTQAGQHADPQLLTFPLQDLLSGRDEHLADNELIIGSLRALLQPAKKDLRLGRIRLEPLAAAMGVHGLFLRYGLAETAVGVILVHLIQSVPYAILMLAGSFSRLDPDIEAQARTLGASPAAVLRYVTLPAIAPGIAVAAAFAFLISWSQYLMTILIGGGRVLTLPLALIAFQRGGDEAITAALSLVFLFPTLTVFVAVSRYLRYET